jgi:hypothetical protein
MLSTTTGPAILVTTGPATVAYTSPFVLDLNLVAVPQ